MRYTGPRGKSFSGDWAKAQSLQRAVDLLVGQVLLRLKAPPFNGQGYLVDRKRLDDGSWIGCMVNMAGMQPIVRTWVECPEDQNTQDSLMMMTKGVSGFIVYPQDAARTYDDIFIGVTGYYLDKQRQLSHVSYEMDTEKKAGPVSWWSNTIYANGETHGDVISWDHGLPCRYRIAASLDCSGRPISDGVGDYYSANNGQKNLYFCGAVIPTDYPVVGAAIQGGNVIYVAHVNTTNPYDEDEDKFNHYRIDAQTATFFVSSNFGETWEEIGSYTPDPVGVFFEAPWFFNPGATKAVTMLERGGGTQFDIVEILITHDVDSGWSLSSSVTSRSYTVPSANIPTNTEGVTTIRPGRVTGRTYSDWYAKYNYPFTGEVTILSSVFDELYSWSVDMISAPGAPPDAHITQSGIDALLNYIGAWNACTDVNAGSSEYIPSTGWDTGGCFAAIKTVSSSGGLISSTVVPTYGSYSFSADRTYNASYRAASPTTIYSAEYLGGRLLGVDYDFNGKLTLVEAVLSTKKAEYVNSQQEDFTNVRDTLFATEASGYQIEHDVFSMRWGASVSWDLLINGKVVATAKGETPGGSVTRVINKHIDSRGVSYVESEEAGSQLYTEQVWIFDIDARSNSVLYGKSRLDFSINKLEDDYSESEYLLDGIGYSIQPRNQVATTNLVFFHEGSIVSNTTFTPDQPPAANSMSANAFSLGLVPRMFSYLDYVENGIPASAWDGPAGGFYSVEVYRTWRSTHGTTRNKGSLCVRDPYCAMASYSRVDTEGHGAAMFFGSQYNVRENVDANCSSYYAQDPDFDSLILFPIRAV